MEKKTMAKEEMWESKPRSSARKSKGIVVTVEETANFAYIYEGMYPAVLFEIQEIETEYGASLVWTWSATAGEEMVELSGISSKKISEKSKTYKWVSAILGRKLTVGEAIDLTTLVGREAIVEVEDRKLKDGTLISGVVDVHVSPKSKNKPKTKGKVVETAKSPAQILDEKDEQDLENWATGDYDARGDFTE